MINQAIYWPADDSKASYGSLAELQDHYDCDMRPTAPAVHRVEKLVRVPDIFVAVSLDPNDPDCALITEHTTREKAEAALAERVAKLKAQRSADPGRGQTAESDEWPHPLQGSARSRVLVALGVTTVDEALSEIERLKRFEPSPAPASSAMAEVAQMQEAHEARMAKEYPGWTRNAYGAWEPPVLTAADAGAGERCSTCGGTRDESPHCSNGFHAVPADAGAAGEACTHDYWNEPCPRCDYSTQPPRGERPTPAPARDEEAEHG